MSKKDKLKELDRLWAKYIKKRDKKCQMCGSTTRLTAHHIITRGHYKTRYNPLNGICLCSKCHYLVHQNPAAYEDFFKNKLGEKKYNFLKNQAQKIASYTIDDLLRMEQVLTKLLEGTPDGNKIPRTTSKRKQK